MQGVRSTRSPESPSCQDRSRGRNRIHQNPRHLPRRHARKVNDEVQAALEELATEGKLAKTENVNKIPMFYPIK